MIGFPPLVPSPGSYEHAIPQQAASPFIYHFYYIIGLRKWMLEAGGRQDLFLNPGKPSIVRYATAGTTVTVLAKLPGLRQGCHYLNKKKKNGRRPPFYIRFTYKFGCRFGSPRRQEMDE